MVADGARFQRSGAGRLITAVLATACCILGGCASTGAPEGWLPNAVEAARDPYGGWITLHRIQDKTPPLAGELIATSADSVYVLSQDSFSAVAWPDVKRARVAFFDPETSRASGWVWAGSVLSLSHGLAALISIPLWAVIGGASAAGHPRAAMADYPRADWQELRPYARFPQGLPSALHRHTLAPRVALATREPFLPTDEVGGP